MKVIERVVKSAGSPGENDLWLKEEGDKLSLRAHHNGAWRTVAGGGSDGGSDGGSVTGGPDWDVNDPNAPGYIANRPFYEEVIPSAKGEYDDAVLSIEVNENGEPVGVSLKDADIVFTEPAEYMGDYAKVYEFDQGMVIFIAEMDPDYGQWFTTVTLKSATGEETLFYNETEHGVNDYPLTEIPLEIDLSVTEPERVVVHTLDNKYMQSGVYRMKVSAERLMSGEVLLNEIAVHEAIIAGKCDGIVVEEKRVSANTNAETGIETEDVEFCYYPATYFGVWSDGSDGASGIEVEFNDYNGDSFSFCNMEDLDTLRVLAELTPDINASTDGWIPTWVNDVKIGFNNYEGTDGVCAMYINCQEISPLGDWAGTTGLDVVDADGNLYLFPSVTAIGDKITGFEKSDVPSQSPTTIVMSEEQISKFIGLTAWDVYVS